MDQDYTKMSRADLEVQSRRMESELAVLSSRARANPEGFKKNVDERNEKYEAIRKRIHEIDSEKMPPDPEGTSPTLADAEGNYAADAGVAAVGGIGVKNSNTDPDGVVRRQRKVLADAGVENADEIPPRALAGIDMSDDKASQVDDSEDDDKSKGKNTPKPRPQTK